MMIQLKTILCPIDFSAYSSHVIAWGKYIAEHSGATLIIFHVLAPLRETLLPTPRIDTDERVRRAEQEISVLMEGCALDWKARVIPGDPVTETARAADFFDADLIIVASYGFSGFKRLVIGSVVEKMIWQNPKPHLMLCWQSTLDSKEELPEPNISKIITSCALKPGTPATAEYGQFFSNLFGSRHFLVHSAQTPVPEEEVDVKDSYAAMQENFTHNIEQKLYDLVQTQNKGLTRDDHFPGCSPVVVTGRPDEAIPSFAKKIGADLMVIGVKHRSVLGKLFAGSTTERMLRNAPCHILAIPGDGAVQASTEGKSRPETGVVLDARYLDHDTPHGHPENPERLKPLYARVEILKIDHFVKQIEPRMATQDEILLVHSQSYLNKVEASRDKEHTSLNPDTHLSAKSCDTALLAVGGVLSALDALNQEEVKQAMVLARPPGHHAEKGRAMGFCIFNNIAVGARYARQVLGMKRVLIIDWDIHHGNGTQHIFEKDPTVLFFSIHQFPHYPGTGLFTEAGWGEGEGYTVNVPLPKGYGDAEYLAIFEQLIKPMALEFSPELILVSAGFDIHQSDFLGGMTVSSKGFALLTRSVMTMAKQLSAKLLMVLEGGYHIESLKESVSAVLDELCGRTVSSLDAMVERADRKKLNYALERSIHVHKQFWNCWRNHAG